MARTLDAKKSRAPRTSKPTARDRQAARRKTRERFIQARQAEHDYARRLRQVAKVVGQIVLGFVPDGIVAEHLHAITAALHRYASTLPPWARAVAGRMLADVSRRDERAWLSLAEELGREVRHELARAPTGQVLRSLLQANVDLITSLPRQAAERVHRIAVEQLATGARSAQLAQEIRDTGIVTVNRATLIARTETARATTLLTMARAQQIGSEAYVWQIVRDGNVRHSHREMRGKTVRWTAPPTLDGLQGHAGCLPNCRCFPEPIIPDDL